MAFKYMRLSAEQKAAREQEANTRSSKLLLDEFRFEEYLNGVVDDIELPLDLKDVILQESAPLIPVEEPLIPMVPENGEEPKFPSASDAREFLIPQVPTAEELAKKKRDREWLKQNYEFSIVHWCYNQNETTRRFVGSALSALCLRMGFSSARKWARQVRDRVAKKLCDDHIILPVQYEIIKSKKMSTFFE